MVNRAKERVPVNFDCTVSIGDDRKRCTIRNISHGGVLTVWAPGEFLGISFRLGDRYPLEVRFSEHEQFGPRGLSCVGTVVRVTLERQQVAFRISEPRLGAVGVTGFPVIEGRGCYVM
jgi:PilZ domain